MIARALETLTTAGTLARTVLVLARQLDHAHLLAASEGARADRAELRVAELEAQTRDWAELSGELAAEQPADDALPDLTDAGEAPIPIEPPPDAYHERDRADRLQAMLQACEVELATARAQLQQTERSAGAHLRTIEELRAQIENSATSADRAVGTAMLGWMAAPAEQIPGVAAARVLRRLECTICPYVAREIDEEAGDKCPACGSKLAEVESCDACGKPVRGAYRTGEAEAVLLCWGCARKAEAEEAARPPRIAPREVRYAAVMKVSAEIDAAADDPPPTRPSSATRTT